MLCNHNGTFNIPSSTPQIIESHVSTYTGYNIWSNGYCEQWGYNSLGTNGEGNIVFPKTFANAYYNFISDNGRRSDASDWIIYPKSGTITATGLTLKSGLTGYTLWTLWKASGYLATDQYTNNVRQIIKY